MRARTAVAIAMVVAVGVGSFFGGRASVSTRSTPRSHPLVLAQFQPLSASFTTATSGWTLGTAPCGGTHRCLALLSTTDGGGTWRSVSMPKGLTSATDAVRGAANFLNVRFADAQDGWIFGSSDNGVGGKPVLWSTHDGGRAWHHQALGWVAYGGVFDLEASNGTAQLMAPNKSFGVTIVSSPVTRDAWRVTSSVRLSFAAGGGQQSGAFVLKGSSGWLVEGNDRGTTGSARLGSNGVWKPWTPPCSSVGGSFSIPAASSGLDLVATCMMGGFAQPVSKSAPPGATLGSNWLYFSTNGGNSFVAGPELRPIRNSYGTGVLASPVPSSIFIGEGAIGASELLASFDRGAHWFAVYRGDVFSLAFTSPRHGVGLVISANFSTTSMIMTTDGGRAWRLVTF